MFQNNLSSFDNVTDPEYLAGIGTEFIAERCRTLGKEHDSICMYVKRNVPEIMKHKDYIGDYVKLTDYLNEFIDHVNRINTQKEYAEISNQLESLESSFTLHLDNNERNELRSKIEALRNRLDKLRNKLNELRNKRTGMSTRFYHSVMSSFEGPSSNVDALELIVNGFRYGIVVTNIYPRICLNASDIDVVIANRDILVSLYPSIFEIPHEFIDICRRNMCRFQCFDT